MNVSSLSAAQAFTTKDGSAIRELHHTDQQSLAEATLVAGQATERHHHARTEEIYFVLAGEGQMEMGGEEQPVAAGDAVLIPPGKPHSIRAVGELRFLCSCAPPYSDTDTFFD